MWQNHFSQLFYVHGVSDLRQTEIHTAKPPVTQPSASEFEMTIEKLKRRQLLGTDQIPAEAGGRTIHSDIRKLIISVWNKEKLPEEWKEWIIVPIYKKL
jgi:hypothetical protein